jgi:hypothetical protein
MARHPEAVYQWTQEITTHLPTLRPAHAAGLALWVVGMVVTRSCGLTAVSALLAAWQDRKENTVRAQLREFYQEAAAKAGTRRQAVIVEPCFVGLLRWVLAGYAGPRLALALDATSLDDRFVVLVISVVYRSCAIPVAWAVLPAGEKGAWRAHWLRLLGLLAPAVPAAWTVLVLADRGLYAKWLFAAIVAQGWHPFLRINRQGLFRPAGQDAFQPLDRLLAAGGGAWAGRGSAFVTPACRLECTLVACWAAGCTDPWLILTDLAPAAADAAWYGLRAWIEQGFKDIKRGGWQWQSTRMRDPARVSRLWLALAVATLWLVRVGGAAEDAGASAAPEAVVLDLLPAVGARRRQRRASRLRALGVVRRGWVQVLVALLEHAPLPLGTFRPEPWPVSASVPVSHLPYPTVNSLAA